MDWAIAIFVFVAYVIGALLVCGLLFFLASRILARRSRR